MTVIKLTSKYSLTSDAHNWIVMKDGVWNWYYSTLYDALYDVYFNEDIKRSRASNDVELINVLKKSAEGLYKALKAIQENGTKGKNPIIPEEIKLRGVKGIK